MTLRKTGQRIEARPTLRMRLSIFAYHSRSLLSPCILTQRLQLAYPQIDSRRLFAKPASQQSATMAEQEAVPLTAVPAADQLVEHNGRTYRTIREGQAYILVPPKARTELDPRIAKEATESQKVFYNPIQQFNRDLSVLAIRTFGRDICQRRRMKRRARRKRTTRRRSARTRRRRLRMAERAIWNKRRRAPIRQWMRLH